MSSHLLYVLNVFLHLIAAIAWVGGMLFLVAVVVPAVRTPELVKIRAPLFRVVGLAFRRMGWACLVVLVVTGFINLHFRGVLAQFHDPAFWKTMFGQVLAAKLIVVMLLLVLSAVHDFWIGPKASEAARRQPGDNPGGPWRVLASWMGRINTILALLTILLGVMLVRGRPW